MPFIAPEAVTADDLVVDLRSLEEAPQSPFAGARAHRRRGIDALASRNQCRGRIDAAVAGSGPARLAAADRLRERGRKVAELLALEFGKSLRLPPAPLREGGLIEVA